MKTRVPTQDHQLLLTITKAVEQHFGRPPIEGEARRKTLNALANFAACIIGATRDGVDDMPGEGASEALLEFSLMVTGHLNELDPNGLVDLSKGLNSGKSSDRLSVPQGSALGVGGVASLQPDDALITTKQTCLMLGGCSKMHLWRLVHDEGYQSLGFPKPIEIGKVGKHQRKYFRLGEVKTWIAKRASTMFEGAFNLPKNGAA